MNLSDIFDPYGRFLCRCNNNVTFFLMLAVICTLAADGDPSGQTDKSISKQNDFEVPTTDDYKLPSKVTVVDDQSQSNAVKMYRRLFKQKRASHLEAIKKILQLKAYDKQHKMINLILSKLFTVMTDAKIKLMESGFAPGDPFPTEEQVRDALSIVLENTAFLGEIVLRLPDVTHSVLRNNSEWQQVIHWCIGFSNDTKILSGNDMILINLMAQELGVIEKSPDFINPFRDDTKLEKMVDVEAEKLLREKMKAAKKQERKEKKKHRGPKLSTPRHNEL